MRGTAAYVNTTNSSSSFQQASTISGESTRSTLEVETEGDVPDCSCDYKTREGTTYGRQLLEVKRQGDVSDHVCNYKMKPWRTDIGRTESIQSLKVEGKASCQVAGSTTK